MQKFNEKFTKKCASTTSMEEEDIMNMLEESGPSDDPKMKEHMLCFLRELGVINADGEIEEEVLKEKLTKYLSSSDKAEQIVSKCAVEKDDPAETAHALGKCIHNEKNAK
ncbi:hypothetical protein NQ314_014914 [Rhamnusium bicolor]|uniref:Uncharacterized protein n=1 Tax=Rhamnusium bicolor TaxID=1586634 RepID=A0AAV8X0A1_9CUCU|nr:hypothetical protein NQ314_014914 [Rhamnusium bicolor]